MEKRAIGRRALLFGLAGAALAGCSQSPRISSQQASVDDGIEWPTPDTGRPKLALTPVVTGGEMFLGAGYAVRFTSQRDERFGISAIDLATERPRWQRSTDASDVAQDAYETVRLAGIGPHSGIISSVITGTSTAGTEVIARDPRSGKKLWQRRYEGMSQQRYAGDAEHLYVSQLSRDGSPQRLDCLDPVTGAVRWQDKAVSAFDVVSEIVLTSRSGDDSAGSPSEVAFLDGRTGKRVNLPGFSAQEPTVFKHVTGDRWLATYARDGWNIFDMSKRALVRTVEPSSSTLPVVGADRKGELLVAYEGESSGQSPLLKMLAHGADGATISGTPGGRVTPRAIVDGVVWCEVATSDSTASSAQVRDIVAIDPSGRRLTAPLRGFLTRATRDAVVVWTGDRSATFRVARA